MNARHVASAALATMVLVMGGCSVTPEPEETTPAFATEEEAFAAAEQTYRAYVDALNQVDLSDPETFEPVFALTTGEFENTERSGLSTMHADGWSVSGASIVISVEASSDTDDWASVDLRSCVDVSDVRLIDAVGASVVQENRPPVQSVLIRLDRVGTAKEYQIAESLGAEAAAC